MSDRKFYRTIITMEVLHEGPMPKDWSAAIIWRECTDGAFSGRDTYAYDQPLTGPEMAAALMAQGSDPQFLQLLEDGTDLDEEDNDGEQFEPEHPGGEGGGDPGVVPAA